MIAFRRRVALWALLTTLSLSASTVWADKYSVLAFDNATVQPGGPRPFAGGKFNLYIEGTNKGNFASFGAADFNSSYLADGSGNLLPSLPAGVNAITITLTQANVPFFTNAGALNFYLAEDTTTSIQPYPDSPLFFDMNDPNGEGLNGQLTPMHFLGSVMFMGTTDPDSSGTVDTFTFPSPTDPTATLNPATVAYVLQVLRVPIVTNPDGTTTGGTFRVVITPGDPDVVASYAGFSNTNYNGVPVTGPTLYLDVSF